MLRFLLFLLLGGFAVCSNAAAIPCGGSAVVVADGKALSDPFFTLKISNDKLVKSFRFSVEKDFIKIRCDRKADGLEVVLIVNFCSGSGCADSSNFGIIEASSGNILLKSDQPWKGNAVKANKIMGKEIKPFSCSPDSGEVCLHTKLELS
jgi:hypothetical protein